MHHTVRLSSLEHFHVATHNYRFWNALRITLAFTLESPYMMIRRAVARNKDPSSFPPASPLSPCRINIIASDIEHTMSPPLLSFLNILALAVSLSLFYNCSAKHLSDADKYFIHPPESYVYDKSAILSYPRHTTIATATVYL